MKTLAAALLLVAFVSSVAANTCQAQYPFFPSPYPALPITVSPIPVQPMPIYNPIFGSFPNPMYGGSTIIYGSAFSPSRNTLMPGTVPIVTGNGVHWIGADGRPHGNYRDGNNNIHTYNALPASNYRPLHPAYQAASSGWHTVGGR